MDRITPSSRNPDDDLFSFDPDYLEMPPLKDSGFNQGYKRIKTNPPPEEEISLLKSEKSSKFGPTTMQQEGIHSSGDLVQRSFRLTHFRKKEIEVIEQKADECSLFYEINNEEIQVVGEQGIVFEFLTWLYEFVNLAISDSKGDFGQDELSLSTFHRINKQDILEKAEEMNIVCEFRYHTALITGRCKNLDLFKTYLSQVEMSTKNPLYPKYWDFENSEVYSEIKVLPGSSEFEEVLTQMRKSLYDAEILSLTRIQNNYLMSHYLTNLSMRQEIRGNYLNRKLLFHGTRDVDPRKIYGNFDAGFDLQYARESGMYGKGIYFAQDAKYSHGYSWKADAVQKSYKMILADVFVGKAYESRARSADRNFIKAPDGYDSVHSNKIHVIYNNFHSYPLYVIEYKTEQASKYTPVIPQSLLTMPTPMISQSLLTMPPNPADLAQLFNFVPQHGVSNRYKHNYLNLLNNTNPNPNANTNTNTNTSNNTNTIPLVDPKPAGLSPVALKRVQKELTEIQKEAALRNFIFDTPDEKDPSKLRITCLGPDSTYYEAGIFDIELIFPYNYPVSPPKITFKTPIYHPCIDKVGNICLGMLNHWNPVMTIEHVFLNLSALLHDPLMEESLMPEIDFQYHNDRQGFITQARSWTRTHAI